MDFSEIFAAALAVLRRRWFYLIAPLLVGVPLAVATAMLLPPVYTSSARILVVSQQIPDALARSTVTASATERIALIQQRLLTRENMLDIARRFDVFVNRADLSPTETVEAMIGAIGFSAVAAGQTARNRRDPDTGVTTLTISFDADRATIAARVANELVSRVLEQNLEARSTRASSTLAFFDREVERLGAELAALQEALSSFKRTNVDALPESVQYQRSQISSLREAMILRDQERVNLEARKRILEESLEIGEAPRVGRESREQQQLAVLRAEYAQLSAIYADTHPSLRSLSARIASLEGAVTGRAPGDAERTENAGMTAAAAEMLREIEFIEQQLERLAERRRDDEATLTAVEAALARAPEVEMELTGRQRELETKQAQYQNAVLKQAEAAVGERLEAGQQSERFEIVEQALVPERPASPNRVLVIAVGSALSLAIGGGLMVLVELLNVRLRTPRDVERRLDMTPIVAIPYIVTRAELRRRRMRFAATAMALVIVAPTTLYLVDTYYRPLPLLLQQVMEKTGLDGLVAILESRTS